MATTTTTPQFTPLPNLANVKLAADIAELTDELIFRESNINTPKSAMFWLRNGTRTVDEQDANSRKPFPLSPYFDYIAADMMVRPPKGESLIHATYKSRTLMMSWTAAGLAAHMMATQPDTRVIVQSADQPRAAKIIEKIKVLLMNSTDRLKGKWLGDLTLDLFSQSYAECNLPNGSSAAAFASGSDKIRFEHGTIYIFDEASLEDELLECVTNALAAKTPFIWLIATAKPGPLNEIWKECKQIPWSYNPLLHQDSYSYTHLFDHGSLAQVGLSGLLVPTPGMSNDVTGPIPGLTKHLSPQGWVFIRVHYSCDPSMRDPAKLKRVAKVFGGMGSPMWKREMEIDAEALGGALVHPKYSEAIHVIPDKSIPEHGCLFMSIDPHPRTEHAALWMLVTREYDFYFYRESWPSNVYGTGRRLRDEDECNRYTVRTYAEYIAFVEGNEIVATNPGTPYEMYQYTHRDGGERIVSRLMDQAGKGFRISGEGTPDLFIYDEYRKYGIYCQDPRKSHAVGNDKIDELLEPKPWRNTTRPRLFIAESLLELRAEFRNHRYATTSTSLAKDLNQRVSQFRTHMLDNCRYLLSGNIFYTEMMASNRYLISNQFSSPQVLQVSH
jgi:hypothetical protein